MTPTCSFIKLCSTQFKETGNNLEIVPSV